LQKEKPMKIDRRVFVMLILLAAGSLLLDPFSVASAGAAGTIKGVVKTPWVKRYEAVVYVDHVEGKEFPPPAKPVFMSQKNLVFKPRILPVVKGTTVDFSNDDTVIHNVFAPPGAAQQFNLGTYGVGVTKKVTFTNLGEVPLLCNVHAEMIAYVLVLQNPYVDLTDKAGNFEIRDVPPGTYTVKVWHEKLKEKSQKVTVEAGKAATVEFAGLKKR
jgi:plastocyanin